jgi:hypothetical protein
MRKSSAAVLLSLMAALACEPAAPSGPPAIAYEVEGQDSVRVRNEGGETAARVDLVFRAGSGQARGCQVISGADEQVTVGAESELVSISVEAFQSAQELRMQCEDGTDLRYFRGEVSSGRILPFETVQEVPFRRSNMLWVVFLSGIAVLMLLSFLLSLILDRLFGRLGEA